MAVETDGTKPRPRQPDSRGRIKQIFSVLNRQHAIISDAITGPVEGGPPERDLAIAELVSVNVLMPYDESAYHLNPSMRSFVQDCLNQYLAFESFTRLSGTINKIKSQWNEIAYLQGQGEMEDAERVELAIDFSLTELVHACERNLAIVASQVSSDYGNVSSLKAKLRQNTFYHRQISTMLVEYRAVSAMIVDFNTQARGVILSRTCQLVNMRVAGRAVRWFNRLNDVQTVISRRLFETRLRSQRVLSLSKAALWLAQNPTISGFDTDLDEETIPDGLLAPEPLRLRSEMDVQDRSPRIEGPLKAIMERMKPYEDPLLRKAPEPEVRLLARREMAVVQKEMSPIDTIVKRIVNELHKADAVAISVLHWMPQERRDEGLNDEQWLLYAATQLAAYEVRVEYVHVAKREGVYNSIFRDVLAQPFRTKKPVAA